MNQQVQNPMCVWDSGPKDTYSMTLYYLSLIGAQCDRCVCVCVCVRMTIKPLNAMFIER